MKYVLALIALMATPAMAQTTVEDWRADPAQPVAADQVDIADFKWQARTVIVFAESEFDPAFVEQMELLTAGIDDLIDRDILWVYDTVTDPASDLRRKLRPHGFGLVLIGKDGSVKLRKALPWDVREISRVIDKMPMRQLEVQERRGSQMVLGN